MLLSLDDALNRIAALLPPRTSITMPIAQANGMVLAEPVFASLNNPPFNASAMDGYALKAADLNTISTLELIGASLPGAPFTGTLEKGQCIRIFTGAPVPDSADCVIMQEEVSVLGNQITFATHPSVGKNIRPIGNDFHLGDELISKGTILTPYTIALAAAANSPTVQVVKPLKISIISTGDELVEVGSAVTPDQIVASNALGLSIFFQKFGSKVTDLGIIKDDKPTLDAAIAAALADTPDILITTGGASVGDHDYVQQSLIDNGVDIDFWRIALRPGKPLMVGKKGNTLVFGLPGNPVSALVTSKVVVEPSLNKLMGATPKPNIFLPLHGTLKPNAARRHFIRGKFSTNADGQTAVQPIPQTDSGQLHAMAHADCLITQYENCTGKNDGDLVEITIL